MEYGSQKTVENSERDGNTSPPYLPPEKSICRSRSNSLNWTWNNGLIQTGKGVCQGCILSSCLFIIKIKSCCTTKETISKVKRQPSEWEKIIANKATNEELISKIYNGEDS